MPNTNSVLLSLPPSSSDQQKNAPVKTTTAAAEEDKKSGDVASEDIESDEYSEESSIEGFYGTSPPSTPRQIKRMSTKYHRNNVGKTDSRSGNKVTPDNVGIIQYAAVITLGRLTDGL
ncbi:mitogen-activated protein kinase kinase kinase 4-like [Rhincodon typus]|uniref:mitogen-activated protein kinase kinase kinase 4-like n=1 Tax=Rhincodon typus TaxID=259920 RepID=UPI00202ECAFD|nr:mitogen-activated protein kinase kinase kinase 4-like [Rhincodon typus]